MPAARAYRHWVPPKWAMCVTACVLSLPGIYSVGLIAVMFRYRGTSWPEFAVGGCANALFVPLAAAQWLAVVGRRPGAADYVVLICTVLGAMAAIPLLLGVVAYLDAPAMLWAIDAAVTTFFFLTAWINFRWALMLSRPGPRHLCTFCGYDLRATPDASGAILPRCPECGQRTSS